MVDIGIYMCIIILGAFLVRKNKIPKKILEKSSFLQSISLYILLGAMGLKIGANKDLMSNLHVLGAKSFLVSFFSILFSVFFVKIFYRGGRK